MSLPAHLLSLADLHAAAPGVLDVVFGPDGDFEGAPRFAGPVFAFAQWWTLDCTTVNVRERGDHYVLACNGWATSLDECYLDLRTSAGTWLAGWCARALLPSGRSSATWALVESDGGTFLLCAAVRHGITWTWDSNGHARGNAPSIHGAEEYDRFGFLRALTLALAPRIAALRTTASPR